MALASLLAAGAAQAQPLGYDADAAIATAPQEITPPADVVAPPATIATGPIDLSETRASLRTETTTAAVVTEEATARLQDEDAAQRKRPSLEIGPNASLGVSATRMEAPMGGFMESNPQLSRRNAKRVGFSFKF